MGENNKDTVNIIKMLNEGKSLCEIYNRCKKIFDMSDYALFFALAIEKTDWILSKLNDELRRFERENDLTETEIKFVYAMFGRITEMRKYLDRIDVELAEFSASLSDLENRFEIFSIIKGNSQKGGGNRGEVSK